MPSISNARLSAMLTEAFANGRAQGQAEGRKQAFADITASEDLKRVQAVTNLLQEGGKMMSKAGWLLRSHTKQQGR